MDRIERVREVHPWASEEEIRFVLMSRYWHFTRELNFSDDAIYAALENCVLIYRRLTKEQMMAVLHRMRTHFIKKQQ